MSGSAEAVTALVFDAGPAVQGAAQFDAAGQKIITTNTAVVNATARTVDAQANLERQLARLTRQIDPAAAAQAKLETGQRLLDRAYQRGAISAEEHARRLAQLDARYGEAASAASRFAAANDNASASTSRFGGAVGQASFQVQDFLTQVQMGQNALMAFGVQFAQLAGSFGTAGAVLGAVVVFGTLAAQMVGLGSATDTLTEATDAVTTGYDRLNDAAERRLRGLEDEAEAVLRLADEYRGMGLAAARAESLLVERRGAALDLEAGRMREALQAQLSDRLQLRLNPPDGSRGSEFGVGDLGLARADEQLAGLADLLARIRSEAGQTQQNMRELAAEADRLAQAGGSGADSFIKLRNAALDLLPAAAQLDAAQRQLAVQTIAAAEAVGASDEVVARYAARFGTLATEIRNAARQMNALRQGGMGVAESAIAGEIRRNEAVLAAIRAGGIEAGRAAQEAGTREEQILRRATELATAARREMEAAQVPLAEIQERLRESQTEFVTLATRAVDSGRAVTDGLKPPEAGARSTAAAVRDIAQAYAELRRDAATGLLLVSDADARAVREISQQLRGTALDPALRARAEAEITREAERRQREADRFTQNWGDRLALETTRGFFEGSKNGETFFQRMGNSLRNILISAISAALSSNVFQPLISSVIGGGTGGGGFSLSSLFGGGTATGGTPGGTGNTGLLSGFGTLRQAYNGLTSPGGLGSFFPGGLGINTGFGGIDGLLNASLVAPSGLTDATSAALGGMGGAFGPATPGAVMAAGASPGLTVASSLGPLAAIGGGIYGAYQGIQRGGVGGYTSAAGGAISAATGIGMLGAAAGLLPALGVLGPIGLGVGALLAIGGALLPGAKPSGQGQLARADLATGGLSFDGLGGKRFSQGNLDAATSAVTNIEALAREIGDKLGGARIGGNAAVGVTNSTLYLDINGAKAQFANNEDGAKALAQEAAKFLIWQFGDQRAAQGPYRGIVDASGGSLEKLSADLQWYEQVYKAFEKTTAGADQAGEAMRAVEAKFKPLVARANELGLSTDNLVKAWDDEWQAAKRAIEAQEAARKEQEAARQRELASLRTALQARIAATGSAADYEARMLASQAARWQAWGDELRSLEERLIALGETTASVAAITQQLRDAQGAEYWRNFASSMQALDQSVIGRILRANGRVGEAERLDFEAGARAQIDALRISLADLGLTAEQAAGKIAETQQAIDAERQARARAANEQIVALDQSVISRILRATGRGAQADVADFEAAAAREVRELARTLDDLGFSAEVVSRKIIETEQAIAAERIALQKRIADEAAATSREQMRQVLAAGQSIRSYIDAQRAGTGPGGVSAAEAFAAAQGQFGTDLTLARGGDQDALARITSTADRLLQAGQRQFASGVDFQAVRSFVLASLESLPATRSYDSLILDELRKLGGAVNVEVGVAVVRTITEALNVLPSADLARLVQAETVLRDVRQSIGRDLTPAERASLVQSSVAIRTVEQSLGRDLTPAERASLVAPATALRLVEQAIGRNLTTAERDGLIQSAAVQRNVEQALGRALTPAERALLVEPGLVSRSVMQAIGAPTGAAVITPGIVDRTVRQAVETTETVHISRSIDDKLSGILNAQLVIGEEQVSILGTLATDMNHLWRYAAGEAGGVVVRSAYEPGRQIVAFARGGVFDNPTTFPMAGGRTGLLGEAGPEAIMPLRRTADGALGVRAMAAGNSDLVVELRALRREVAELRQERAAASERQARVTAAVGEETLRQGQETNALLRSQADQQRLAGAA
jgi:hypothetical protein